MSHAVTIRSKILLVDDTPENLDVLSAILEDVDCQLLVATTGERALELTQKQQPDLILLDVMMPGMNGFDVCNRLKQDPSTAQIPIIFVTARSDDISLGFSVGGCDYITKPINADEVRARVKHQLERKYLLGQLQTLNKQLEQKVRERTAELTMANHQLRQEIQERRYMQDRLNYLATHDFVTHLYNRNSLETHVSQLLAKIQTVPSCAALIYIDLDRFRVINESYGCIAGDELLKQIADTINGALSREDFIARIGSDKFAVVHQHPTTDTSMESAQLILDHIKDYTFHWEERDFKLAACIAVVPLTADIVSYDQAMLMADEVMFMVKREGRGLVRRYAANAAHTTSDKDGINWALRLVDASHNKNFRAHFQLIHPLADELVGRPNFRIETLIRLWDPLQQRLIPPAEFIGPAERLHLIPELDRWMAEEVLRLLATHRDLLSAIDRVSMNLSALTIREPNFAQHIANLIQVHQVPAHKICFEITETEAITNIETAKQFMAELKHIGCHFALDDFGSGFASYAYLHQLEFDTLKVDGIFVHDMDQDTNHYAMVKAIVDMAHSLNKEVVAEFVETPEAAALLKGMGVSWAQGFHYHKPEALSYEALLAHIQQ